MWRTPRLAAAAAAQVALLLALAFLRPVPVVPLAEAAAHEGQGDIRTAGFVADVRPGDRSTRLALQEGAYRLDVVAEGGVSLARGTWVVAEGRVGRSGGTLTLFAQELESSETPAPLRPAWADVAARPADWSWRPIVLEGRIERGALHDADGHHVRLAEAQAPTGHARVHGTLGYEAGCLCHVLWPERVEAGARWTP